MSYDTVVSLLRWQSVWAVLMCLYSIAIEYNGPLEAARTHIDGDRYDMVNQGAAGQIKRDLSGSGLLRYEAVE